MWGMNTYVSSRNYIEQTKVTSYTSIYGVRGAFRFSESPDTQTTPHNFKRDLVHHFADIGTPIDKTQVQNYVIGN